MVLVMATRVRAASDVREMLLGQRRDFVMVAQVSRAVGMDCIGRTKEMHRAWCSIFSILPSGGVELAGEAHHGCDVDVVP